jgi:hypothetical protein
MGQMNDSSKSNSSETLRLSDQGPMATWVMFLAASIMSISLDPTCWNFLTRVQGAQTKDAVERFGFASTAREDQMRLRTFSTGLTKCLEE